MVWLVRTFGASGTYTVTEFPEDLPFPDVLGGLSEGPKQWGRADWDPAPYDVTAPAIGWNYVGGKKYELIGNGALSITLDGLTGGLDTSPSEGDVVCVQIAVSRVSVTTLDITTSGYTKSSSLFVNDQNDINAIYGVKRMGATPDTTIEYSRSSLASTGAMVATIQVFRGADATTPLDVGTITTATGANSRIPNPPEVTTVTDGALVIVMGCCAHAGGDLDMSAGYLSDVVAASYDGTTNDVSALSGSVEVATAGAYNGAALTITGDSTDDSWACGVVVLRPAV